MKAKKSSSRKYKKGKKKFRERKKLAKKFRRRFLVAKKNKKKKRVVKKRAKKIIKKSKKLKSVKKFPKKLTKRRIKNIIPKNKSVRAKRIKTFKKTDAFSPESFFKAKIKVIGIGGGGGSIVSEIGRSLHKATFVVADTDVRSFKKKSGIKYFLFGQELTHGLGTGLNPDLARSAAEQEKEKITKLFENQDIVIFIASLGGGVGSGATKVFVEAFKDFKGIAFGIFTLPFKFEGKSKYKIAYKYLKELRKLLNVSITIPNERIFKVIDSNVPITEAFSVVNKNLIESLESLIDLIYSPGIINIDFADVRAILQGKGNVAFLNIAEASGKDKVEKITKEVLHNPLYQNNNFVSEKVLFNIEGGKTLSMFEVDIISRVIAEQNPKAKIIFGISKNAKYSNKIKTTLLMTGPVIGHEETVAKQITEKPLVKEKEKKPLMAAVKVKKKENKKSKNVVKDNIKKEEKIPFVDTLMPVFNNEPAELSLRKFHSVKFSEDGNFRFSDNARVPKAEISPKAKLFNRVNIVETSQFQSQSDRGSSMESGKPKKPIRRTGLEIKQAQEVQENEKSMQEKEWEIPAFLRKVKFKP